MRDRLTPAMAGEVESLMKQAQRLDRRTLG